MNKKVVQKTIRRVELLLFAVGVLCAGYLFVVGAQSRVAHASAAAFGQADRSGLVQAEPAAGAVQGTVIGRLEIRAIGLSVPILSNFEQNSLLRGIGHIEGTALPGGLGTMGLAGHRDTYFRPLRNIALGMRIDVTDETGTYHYQVDSTEIVTPEEVRVLNIMDRPKMTLVTCYPFNYVGAAPKRFIVHAHLLSLTPDVKAN